MGHLQRQVHLKDSGMFFVDRKIVKLVVALNDLGMKTHMSCQNNVDGRVWISFWHANQATEFLELIAKKASFNKCIFNATTQGYDKLPSRWKFKDRWWVDSYVQAVRDGSKHNPTGDICIRISVRFPKKHLEEVTKIVVKKRDKMAKIPF